MSARIVLMVAALALVLVVPASAQYPWCLDMDYFTTSVEDGVITITHYNAVYNCCPDYFEYTVNQQGNQIMITETEVLSIPCTCICCYDLPLQIGPLAPGVYEIDFCWYDYESGIRHEYLVVEVPDSRQGGEISRSTVIVHPDPCTHYPPADVEPGLSHIRSSGMPFLSPGWPNPTAGSTSLSYELAEDAWTSVTMFSAGGARVRTLMEGAAQAGRHSTVWDGMDESGKRVPAGVYFCRLHSGGKTASRTVVVVE